MAVGLSSRGSSGGADIRQYSWRETVRLGTALLTETCGDYQLATNSIIALLGQRKYNQYGGIAFTVPLVPNGTMYFLLILAAPPGTIDLGVVLAATEGMGRAQPGNEL